ncbi:MAG: Zn-ribbon domain-containing OB-fold protein [Gammaproteobacteria bacterium]
MKPLPAPDPVTQFHWDAAARGELMVQRCAACGHHQFPPDIRCRACGGDRLGAARVSGRGALYSFTISYRSVDPSFNESVPFVVALVELAEQPGLRLLTNIVGTDPDTLRIGMPLHAVFEERGGMYIPQFTVDAASGEDPPA